MPTYEYVCRECGQHLEVVQSFNDRPLETRERCGGSLRKVFSAAGIIFKGSGYYVTDTRAARSGAKTASGSDSTSEGSEATSTSSDSSSKGDGAGSSSGTDRSSSASTSDAKSA